jgi:hypothetical protein
MTLRDREHLRLLSICHYLLAGFTFVVGGAAILILSVYVALSAGGAAPGGGDQVLGAIFGVMLMIEVAPIVLVMWLMAGFIAACGRCLAVHKHYRFCLVVAQIECLWIPFGTILGVFTLIVLFRPAVDSAFKGLDHLSWRDEPPEREPAPSPDGHDGQFTDRPRR